MAFMKPLFPFAILLLFLAGCQKPLPANSTWSGTISLAEGRTLPLRMQLDLQSTPPTGVFLTSNDQTPIPEIRQNGDSLVITLSEYGAAMKGIWDGTSWNGKFLRFRTDTVSLEFHISPEATTTTAESPPAVNQGIRLVGTYRVFYTTPGVVDTTTMAKFWMRGDSVFGTFIDPSGDHGLMAGVQNGSKAWVGRFNGWQANLIEVEQAGGTWTGRYYARQLPPAPFRLEPRPSIPEGPLDKMRTRMKNSASPFRFEGITADGDTLASGDQRFKGKVLLIDIMGTWCHNCLDETPLLQQLYTEFHDQGLEVVGLSFEVSSNPEVGRKNLQLYRSRQGLTYPLLFAGSLDEQNVKSRLTSQLDDFFAYPTAIFVDRTGHVKKIHWGFKGPGTGEPYQHEVQIFYETVKKLLSEHRR
jgi:thiol-disulfide isomerase/thioredoxin